MSKVQGANIVGKLSSLSWEGQKGSLLPASLSLLPASLSLLPEILSLRIPTYVWICLPVTLNHPPSPTCVWMRLFPFNMMTSDISAVDAGGASATCNEGRPGQV